MGYRSQVRVLIYGDPDKLNALLVSRQLLGEVSAIEDWGSFRRYRIKRRLFDYEASDALGPSPDNGRTQAVYKDVEIEVLDFEGDYVKWCPEFPDVAQFTAMMHAAPDLGLSYEFIRIGEDDTDIESESHIDDDGDWYLGVDRCIRADIPNDRSVVPDQTEAKEDE